jgi:hypothetical protein
MRSIRACVRLAMAGLLAAAACTSTPPPSPGDGLATAGAIAVPSASATGRETASAVAAPPDVASPSATAAAPSAAPAGCASITSAGVDAAVRALPGWTSVRSTVTRRLDGSVVDHAASKVEFIGPDAMATTYVDLLRGTRNRIVLLGDRLWLGTARPQTTDGSLGRNVEFLVLLPNPALDGRFKDATDDPDGDCVASQTSEQGTTTYWMTRSGLPIRRHIATKRFDEELTFDPSIPDAIEAPGGVPQA